MKLYIQKDRARISFKFNGTVRELLDRIAVNPETVMVTKNGSVVPEDAAIEDSDSIEVLPVVSGG
jgi:sulfur carrier protein ThiS